MTECLRPCIFLTEMQFDGNVITGLVLYITVIEIRWDHEEGLHDGPGERLLMM